MYGIILKRIAIVSLFLAALAVTVFIVHGTLRWVVTAALGNDIVQSAAFYVAVVALSLTIYFCLIVLGTQTLGKIWNSRVS